MKHIGTPVNRLTASCILRSFLSSNKRHLILTGRCASERETLVSDCLSGQRFLVFGQSSVFDEFCQVGDEADVHPDITSKFKQNRRLIASVGKQKLPAVLGLCKPSDVFLVDLDDPYGRIGCVIMASGLGKRFGSNKMMADFRGKAMISYILNATEGVFSKRVVVTRHDTVAVLCESLGIYCIRHDLPLRSDTIRLGMTAMSDMERCMFAPADQPLLRHETVAALALASANAPEMIVRPACDGIPGAPVVFPNWAFGELQSLSEGKGGGVIVKKHPERLHIVNVRDAYELKDIDSQSDLVEFMER